MSVSANADRLETIGIAFCLALDLEPDVEERVIAAAVVLARPRDSRLLEPALERIRLLPKEREC